MLRRPVVDERQQLVEHRPEPVDEVHDVPGEVAVVGRDDRQPRVVLEQDEAGEVHGLELVERRVDRIGRRLPEALEQREQTFLGPVLDRHHEGERALDLVRAGTGLA
jgi:hypothetical protein